MRPKFLPHVVVCFATSVAAVSACGSDDNSNDTAAAAGQGDGVSFRVYRTVAQARVLSLAKHRSGSPADPWTRVAARPPVWAARLNWR